MMKRMEKSGSDAAPSRCRRALRRIHESLEAGEAGDAQHRRLQAGRQRAGDALRRHPDCDACIRHRNAGWASASLATQKVEGSAIMPIIPSIRSSGVLFSSIGEKIVGACPQERDSLVLTLVRTNHQPVKTHPASV